MTEDKESISDKGNKRNKIVFQHYRVPDWVTEKRNAPKPDWLFHYRKGQDRWRPNTRGGKTTCTLIINGKSYYGESLCSMADNFNYAEGRKLALTRSLLITGYLKDIENDLREFGSIMGKLGIIPNVLMSNPKIDFPLRM